MPYQIARYGWVRDLPDQRDHLYAAPPQFLSALPSQVDLRPQCPPIYDQGQLGSCTANAIGAAHEFSQMKQGLPAPAPFGPSRLFIYYNERAIEHTTGSDSGAQIRDGMKSVAKLGVCREDPTWPYDADPFPPNNKLTQKPSDAAYAEALKYQAIQYQRVPQVLSQMKGCLAAGYPFVFGFTVYESFESQQVAQSGVVPMPHTGEQVLGGHAVLAVGYDDTQQRFIVRNSWGTSWGDKGYCHMPYLYLTDPQLASDIWTLRLIEK
jgi:C1A family cysteine protease